MEQFSSAGMDLEVGPQGKKTPTLEIGFGERRLEKFFPPIKAGEMVYMEANTPYLFTALYMLIASSLRRPGGKAIYIDGFNNFNPFRVVRMLKRWRIKPMDGLKRVQVARPFTAYQMVAIITEKVERVLQKNSLFIISGFYHHFSEGRMDREEARAIILRAGREIERITKEHLTATVVVDAIWPGVSKTFRIPWERHLRILQRRGWIRLEDATSKRSMSYTPVPPNQIILDDYMEV